MKKKPDKILVATGNKGKLLEISKLLQQIGIKAVGAFDFGLPEPAESGKTFEENSVIKAKYYGDKSGLVSLADDSGLCVDAIAGAPGIYSARWAEDKDFNTAFAKIRQELIKNNINPDSSKLSAYFVCNLSIYYPETSEIKSFEGRVDGTLSFPPKGDKGFGYDPIFIPNGYNITFGEMNQSEKDLISHRAKAFEQLVNWYS